LDLVSKQEIERQKTALHLANQRLEALQKQVSLLEEALKNKK
ncbi:MAG: membrane fusogenic activity, partial [Acinetobacter baumannii]|nr:membrane fusogenic activity [Acinetobacter baumannii]